MLLEYNAVISWHVLIVEKFMNFNPIALRMAKTLWSFGHLECNRVRPPKGCDSILSMEGTIAESKYFRFYLYRII